MIQDQINRKKRDQLHVKETGGGFSFMNSLWGQKKEEEVGLVAIEKEEAELKVKKAQIDSELAAECLYCGPGIVDTITMTFDNEILRDSWKI